MLQHEHATRHLLVDASRTPNHDVIPATVTQWRRAAANADLQPHLDDYTALLKLRKSSPSEGWEHKFGPFLLSATANKQWPQASVASVRHPDWCADAGCQLC